MAVPARSSHTVCHIAFRLAAVTACIVVWSVPVHAQVFGSGSSSTQETAQQAEPPPADTAEAVPSPIVASEIGRRAEKDITELNLIRTLLRPDPAISRIAERFPAEAEERRRLADESAVDFLNPLPRRLSEIRNRWNAQQGLLRSWEEAVVRRASELERERRQMQLIREDWTLTANNADSVGLPPALVQRAISIVAQTDTLEVRFDERFTAVLTLQDRIADGLIEAAEMQARIREAQDVGRQRLLVRERLPLWKALGRAEDDPGLAESVRANLSEDARAITAYTRDHRQDLLNQLVLFVLLLALMFWLSHRSRRWSESVLEDESMAASIQVVRRPISSALLLTLWLTATFQPRLPDAVGALVELLAIVPVLRLIPDRLRKTLRTPIYGLVGLFVLTVVYELGFDQSLLERLVLLALTLAAFAGLIWVVRPGSQLHAMRSTRGWGAVFAVARLGVVVLAVSLVTNTIGNVSLSEVLTLGTISAALYATLVYALVWVLHGLWRLVLRSRAAGKLNVIRHHRDQMYRFGTIVLNVAGVLLWLRVSLTLVRLWSPLIDRVRDTLTTSLTLGSVTIEVGGVLAFVAVLVFTTIASRIIRVVLAEDVLARTQLPRGLPGTISTVVHYAIITLGFLLAMAAAGIELSRVVVLAGALGVGIGFGLQDIVRNFVSGLILAFERPFGIGDVIEVGTLLGKVRRIGARSSTIRTYDGADVIVPNSTLVSDQLTNWTKTDSSRRITIAVGVAYGSDPEHVLAVLREVAEKHPEVSRYPEPMVLFRGFGDSALNFELRFWISDVERTLRADSAMTNAVHDALKAAGITIPFPQRDVHLRTVGDDGQVAMSGQSGAEPDVAPVIPTGQ